MNRSRGNPLPPNRGVVVVQLLMFHSCPDSDQPECICSLCRRPFTIDEDEDLDDALDIPVRMWPENAKGKSWEIRFHVECLEQVCIPGQDPAKFQWKPGLHIAWSWGDDANGKLLAEPLAETVKGMASKMRRAA